MTDTPTEVPTNNSERDKAIRKAYATATAKLREKYLDEFHQIQQAEAKELGFDWSPRPTKEQQAREQIASLLSQFPKVRQEVIDEVKKADG